MNFMIISSLLLGSVLGEITTHLLLQYTSFRFLSLDMPTVSLELQTIKTTDLLDFGFTFLFAIVIYLANQYIRNSNKTKKHSAIDIFFFITSFILFIQTHFSISSGKTTLLLFLAAELSYFFLNRYPNQIPTQFSLKAFTNSLFLGIPLVIVFSFRTTSFSIPLLILLVTIYLYQLLAQRKQSFINHPLHFLYPLSIFLVHRTSIHLASLITVLTLITLTTKIFVKRKGLSNIITTYFYPISMVLLLLFNPHFAYSHLDSIEEGFWLAWIQRLSTGDIIYKDFFVYHPPLLPWLTTIFSQLTDFSVANLKLFFHLLQLAGLTIIYFTLKHATKKTLTRILGFILIAAITTTSLVKNNAEIRVAIGLLPLLFYLASLNRSPRYLLLSGLLTSIALMTSLEAGLASLLALTLSVIIFDQKVRSALYYYVGVIAGLTPFVLILSISGALKPFLYQSSFYANALSQGYFNTPLPQSIITSYFRWHLFYQYFATEAFYWDLTRFVFVAAALAFFTHAIANKKIFKNLSTLSSNNKFIYSLALYGLLLSRAALGRSDYYHILFPLIVAIIVLFHYLDSIKDLKLYFVFLFSFIMVAFTNQINNLFLSATIHKFFTYKQPAGEHTYLDLDRGKIFLGPDGHYQQTKDITNLIQKELNPNESFFAFPWAPELYFLADRNNSTSYDTPYASFSEEFQLDTINQLKANNPKLIVVDTDANFGGFTAGTLSLINDYVGDNYTVSDQLGPYQILRPIEQ